MLKLISISGLFFLLASCALFSQAPSGQASCPWVTIPRATAYATQKVNYADEFQLELKGYEAYCSEENGRRYAVITPLFEVYRLLKSDESRVDFNFYTETVQGPPGYIGKRSYAASALLNPGEAEKEFRGRTVRVKLPPENADRFEILLGLDLSADEKAYNRRTFDIPYRYDADYDYPVPGGAVRYQPLPPVPSADGYYTEPEQQPASGCNSCGFSR